MLTRRASLLFPAALAAATPAQAGAADVVKRPLAPGVSADDAAQSLKLRASALNIKMTAESSLSEQVALITGKPQRHITIFQFCDPLTAQLMVEANPDLVSYMPCRIALVEDVAGQFWLIMTNLDPLVAAVPPELRARADRVRAILTSVLEAGAAGDL